ncbi:MAG: molybdopterin-dependent oxidoreductase [Methanobacterium sp.]
MDRKIIIILVILILVVIIFSVVEYQQNQPVKLQGVQVNNYQGQKLTSISSMPKTSIKGTQYVNMSNYTLEITGLVQNPRNFTYAEVLNHTAYQKVVTLNCVEGWDSTILWQGVLVSDLLKDVKPLPSGTTVIFTAADNYTTSFPIDYLYNNNILLAYKMNNVTIPPEYGFPFQLVAESKWGYKWIKWVTKIEVSNNTNYTGYWESRGYTNVGDLNQSFLGS